MSEGREKRNILPDKVPCFLFVYTRHSHGELNTYLVVDYPTIEKSSTCHFTDTVTVTHEQLDSVIKLLIATTGLQLMIWFVMLFFFFCDQTVSVIK